MTAPHMIWGAPYFDEQCRMPGEEVVLLDFEARHGSGRDRAACSSTYRGGATYDERHFTNSISTGCQDLSNHGLSGP